MNIVILALILSIVVPIGMFYLSERRAGNFKKALAFNLVTFFGVLVVATVVLLTGNAMAEETALKVAGEGVSLGEGLGVGLKYMAAALAVSCSTIGAGIATGKAASAALGALSENEHIMGKALIFVALAEGVAIYGLLISFIIINS